MHDGFRTISRYAASAVGSGWTFLTAVAVIWFSGNHYNYSQNWKINASLAASVISLLFLVLLQRSQNHSDKATHVKLDELIAASQGARNAAASVEDGSEDLMDRLKATNPAERETL